jgi:hypothetical protein
MHPIFNAIWQIISGGIVLVLPGLAWLVWFSNEENDVFARLAEAMGLSIAASSLIALAGFVLGAQYSTAWLVLFYGLSAFFVFLGVALRGVQGIGTNRPFWQQANALTSNALRNLVLLAIFAGILAWRFYQVRALVLPAWVDSLHHVLITRVILERGGVPPTLDPYLPVPFYYHFSFHVLASLFSFWSSLPPERAVLVMGQVLNAVVTLSVYRLGISLWRDWRRAGLAALLVGFVSQMPAYYATWGRYTLLTGLVLLPLAMAAGVDLVNKGMTRRRIAWLALLTGGVLLAHYFAALLLALFLSFLGTAVGIQDLKQRNFGRDSRFMALLGAAMGGALLALPWIWRVWNFSIQYVRIDAVLPADSLDGLYFPDYVSYLWRMAGPFRNHFLLGLALPSLIMVFIRNRHRYLVWWAVALVLMSIPWGINVSPFRPDHSVIVLFLPAALLAADFLFTLAERAQVGLPRLGRISLGAAILGLLVWGVHDTHAILNPATIFATESDLRAMDWIAVNTHGEARFFINVTPWQYGVYRGVDGGWWIEALTNRETLLPAVMYAMGDQDYLEQVSSRAQTAGSLKGCSTEFRALLREAGLTYVYLVKGHGSLQSTDLQDCPYVHLVYQHQDISIYQVTN